MPIPSDSSEALRYLRRKLSTYQHNAFRQRRIYVLLQMSEQLLIIVMGGLLAYVSGHRTSNPLLLTICLVISIAMLVISLVKSVFQFESKWLHYKFASRELQKLLYKAELSDDNEDFYRTLTSLRSTYHVLAKSEDFDLHEPEASE